MKPKKKSISMIEKFKNKDLSHLDELYVKLKSKHDQILPSFNAIHLQKVGLFIARFQRIEYSIKELISFFYNRQILDLVLDEISFSGLLTILRKINTIKFTGLENKNLSFLIEQTGVLNSIRNIIVHSIYAGSPGNSLNLLKGSKKNGNQKEFYEITPDEFDVLILITEKLMNSFSSIAFSILKNEK